MDAIALMGHVIRSLAQATADRGGIGCAKLVTFANMHVYKRQEWGLRDLGSSDFTRLVRLFLIVVILLGGGWT